MKKWLFGLALVALVTGWAMSTVVDAQTRRTRSPLVLQYRTDSFMVYCEAGTRNRVYYAYDHGASGVAVVEGGCQ